MKNLNIIKSKNIKKILITLSLIFASLFFNISCTSEIELELSKEGILNLKFSGSMGEGFINLINIASGTSIDDNSTVSFDTEQIELIMTSVGFTDVKAVSQHGTDVLVTMKDESQKSDLFTTNILSINNNKLYATITPQVLLDFYNNSSEDFTMFLDIFLSPLFNQEEMSPEEYIETLQIFYGDKVSDEIKNSDIKITIKNPDGTKISQNVPLTTLLTLNQIIILGK